MFTSKQIRQVSCFTPAEYFHIKDFILSVVTAEQPITRRQLNNILPQFKADMIKHILITLVSDEAIIITRRLFINYYSAKK